MGNIIQPIKPGDINKTKTESMPDEVIQSFNELIIEKYNGTTATFTQEDVVDRMVQKGLDKKEIFKKHWLDIEENYRNCGWEVNYDKPGFNESYDSVFTFTTKKQ